MRIDLEHVTKRFRSLRGRVTAVDDVSLTVEDGELFVLLGPSGCGKSTLLNLVAGLDKPSGGTLRFGGRVVAGRVEGEDSRKRSTIFLPPRERDVAMVFQSYALYPHKDVFHNIAFPLRIARLPKDRIRAAVHEIADLLAIRPLLDRRPGELSGGQRQRVAMARALVRRPAVFLLDEPLSNLDAQLRTATRTELKRLQRDLGVTTLYVTHDQVEAMTLGDRVALLRDGRVVQVGTPTELYDLPATPFAATFVGTPPMNLLPARLEGEMVSLTSLRAGPGGTAPGRRDGGPAWHVPAERRRPGAAGDVLLGVRPESVALCSMEEEAGEHPRVEGRVTAVELLGREALYHVDVGGTDVLATTPRQRFDEGDGVRLRFDPERLHAFPRGPASGTARSRPR